MVTSGSFGQHRSQIVEARADGKGMTNRPRRATLAIGSRFDFRECMNDPEVTMNNVLPNSNLIAYRKALRAAAEAISLVRRVPAPVRTLADQVVRSASSVPANLAEGHGRSGRDRMHHWRIAYGSAKEIDCHLQLLIASKAVDRQQATSVLQLFDEVRAMTWRLLHP